MREKGSLDFGKKGRGDYIRETIGYKINVVDIGRKKGKTA